jgi:HEAT repeat protein
MIKKFLVCLCLTLLIPALGAMEFDEAIKELESPDFRKRSEARLSLREALSAASRPDASPSESEELENKLIDFIRSGPAPDAARWGLQLLGQFGRENSTPLFVDMADSDNPGIQMQAVQSLAWSSDPEANSALSKLLDNASTSERKIALIRALGQRYESSGTEESAGLLAFLRPKNKSGDDTAIRQIASFLTDDTKVARAAAHALAHIGSPSSIEALTQARNNHEGSTRIAIESALLVSGPEESLLNDLSLNGATTAIRTAAFQVRVQKDPQKAKEALDQEIELIGSGKSSGELLHAAMNSPLRQEIIESLGQLPAPAQSWFSAASPI